MKEDYLLSFVLITGDVEVNPDDYLTVEHAAVYLVEDVVLNVHDFADHSHLVVVVLSFSADL